MSHYSCLLMSAFYFEDLCYERRLSNPFVFRVGQNYTSEIGLIPMTLLYTEITINHTAESALCSAHRSFNRFSLKYEIYFAHNFNAFSNISSF